MRHFFAWCPDYGQTEDDAKAISVAIGGPREAACEWAEEDDRNSVEYRIAKGNSALILVREKETGSVSAWRVEGEAVPAYQGRPAEVPNAPHEGPGAASSRTVPLDAVVVRQKVSEKGE